MIGRKILVLMIRLYRMTLSPLLGSCCRFYPSCSHYAEEAVTKKGFWKGSFLTIKRILKCNPLHPGGLDPVEGSKI